MRIAIAGAGIGGLALGAFASRAGHDVVLVERAPEFGEVGAGLQLSPNAGRVLAGLGADVMAQLDRVSVTPERVVLRRWADDSELSVTPLGGTGADRWGSPYRSIYRPDLVDVLVRALPDRVDVRLGTSVTGVRDLDDGRVALDIDGVMGVDEIEADLVVGADGVHSVVREIRLPGGTARFSGSVAYRALIPAERVGGLPVEVTNRLGPDRHLVSYFVGQDQRLFNLVAVIPDPEWDVESWTEPGSTAELRRNFLHWSPAVSELLSRVSEPVYRWALYDREPLDRWSDGRVTLLGDAAHPMLPFLAQGAGQAIEDAVALVDALQGVDPEGLPAALEAYEAARRPRTADIQRRSTSNAAVYHLHDGDEQRERDRRMAELRGQDAMAFMDWLYAGGPRPIDGGAEPSGVTG